MRYLFLDSRGWSLFLHIDPIEAFINQPYDDLSSSPKELLSSSESRAARLPRCSYMNIFSRAYLKTYTIIYHHFLMLLS